MRKIEYARRLSSKLYGPLPPAEVVTVISVIEQAEEITRIEEQRAAKHRPLTPEARAKYSFDGRLNKLESDPAAIKELSWPLRIDFKAKSENSERLHAIVRERLVDEEFGRDYAVMASELQIVSCFDAMKQRIKKLLSDGVNEENADELVQQLERTLSRGRIRNLQI